MFQKGYPKSISFLTDQHGWSPRTKTKRGCHLQPDRIEGIMWAFAGTMPSSDILSLRHWLYFRINGSIGKCNSRFKRGHGAQRIRPLKVRNS